MKLLLDTCISKSARDYLVNAGNDVIWTAEWEKDPGDVEILSFAHHEGRILVTLDKDFGELAIVRGLPHSGIIRLSGISSKEQGNTCQAVIERYAQDLKKAAIITVDNKKVRIRINNQV